MDKQTITAINMAADAGIDCRIIDDNTVSFGNDIFVIEKTCHAVDKGGRFYSADITHDLLGAYCSRCLEYLGGQNSGHVGEYCSQCSAHVVPKDEPLRG